LFWRAPKLFINNIYFVNTIFGFDVKPYKYNITVEGGRLFGYFLESAAELVPITIITIII
jgi:hypothetical protein